MKTIAYLISVFVALIFSASAADNAISRSERILLSRLHKESDKIMYLQYRHSMQNSVSGAMQRMSASSSVISLPGLGSYERVVEQYAVPRGKLMALGIYQETDNGPKDVKKPYRGFNLNFSSKAELDSHMREKARLVAEGALTNTFVDLDEPLNIFAYTTYVYDTIDWVNYMYISRSFYLEKNEDGTYSVPDFSDFEMDLVSSMVYEIPNAVRVRFELWYNPEVSGMTGLALVSDSLTSPTGESGLNFSLQPGSEYIDISAEYALLGTEGFMTLKILIYLQDNEVLIFGPYGDQIPHISNLEISDGLATLRVTGERNKSIRIESAPTISGPWVEAGRVLIPYYGSENSVKFSAPLGTNSICIFRAVAE